MKTDVKQIKKMPMKQPVVAVTTAALAANTYANGLGGIGATLTANANGALASVDGVSLALGDRILVKNEASGLKNGIYTVKDLGSAGTPWILLRARDCDNIQDVFTGITVMSITGGAINPNKLWALQTNTGAPIVIGTDILTWSTGTVDQSPTTANKNMAASTTTADFQTACATAVASTPADDSYVRVTINGAGQRVGDGVKTLDCYFSSDGGTTAKLIKDIATGDILYWVGSVAGFELESTDIVEFDYVA